MMIDLFGMKRKPEEEPRPAETPEGAAGVEPAPEPAPRGSHRLWVFLLVLDSVFVIVFGGAVAAKVYQYWKAPAVALVPPAHRRPAPKAPEAAKPAEPAPAAAPAKPAEPPKSAEAPKPEPKPAPKAARAESPRPPKPSLLTEAPKPHEAPKPAAASAAPAAAPAAEGKTKAQAVVFKLRAPGARSVQLVGAFIVRGGRKDMTKGDDGTWTVKLYLNPGQYRYFFSVDRKKQLDPENPRSDRGASLVTVP